VSSFAKKGLVQLITAAVAMIMILDFFFDVQAFSGLSAVLQDYATIIANIALGLGVINLFLINTKQVQRRTEGKWIYSVWLLAFFFICLIAGFAGYITNSDPNSNGLYDWVFNYVYVSLGQTLYAITGFYIFSAAYRAFRVRSLDAAVLLVAGCVVLLTNAPVGEAIWSGFPVIGRWLLDTGQVPAMRTFLIVGALGLLAYGFRALLGKETGFYGEFSE
jgi:hypothetical protein